MSLNGVVVTSHFCQGQLASLGIFSEARNCENCPQNQCSPKRKSNASTMHKSSCCTSGCDYYKVTLDAEAFLVREHPNTSINIYSTKSLKLNYAFTFCSIIQTNRHLPPEYRGVERYLMLGQFLI